MGNQRLLTTNPEDLEKVDDEKLFDESNRGEEEEKNEINLPDRNIFDYNTVHFSKSEHDHEPEKVAKFKYQGVNVNSSSLNSKDLSSTKLTLKGSYSLRQFLIRPNTNFYVFWVFLLCFVVGYDLIIVPFYICFSPEFSIEILIIDLMRILVYFLDIIIQFHSSFEHK